MADVNLSSLGGGSSGAELTAYNMIRTAASTAAINAGWTLAERRAVFDALASDLYDVSVTNTTADAAFDDATDSAALIAVGDFVDDLNGFDYLKQIADASAEMSAYGARYAGDLSTTSYINFGNTSSTNSSMISFDFNRDGTELYTVAQGTPSRIYKFNLSTAWDVTTLSFAAQGTLDDNNVVGFRWKPDGTRFYICDPGGNRVGQYDCSTPWDITSKGSVSDVFIGSNTPDVKDIYLTPDGTAAFFTNNDSTETVEKYTLSTAWDITTVSQSQSWTFTEGAVLGGIWFSQDGTKMYISEGPTSGNQVFQYTLSTPFDLSTVTYDSVQLVSNVDADSLTFSKDGTRFYFLNANSADIFMFSCDAAASTVYTP